LEPVIYSQGAFLIENPRPELGQFSSLQVGLREVLNRGRDAAMITLVDRPPVQTTTLEHLVTEFPQVLGRDKWALVPEHNGKHGHPFLAAREMIEAFLRAPATSTARDIEHQNQKRIAYLPIEDPWVVLNVNTPEDYANLPAGG
jgi:molybdenum cofactor cytidylyltransferase